MFITEKDVADVLVPLGFVRVNLDDSDEITFSKSIMFQNQPTIMRIYTAIFKDSGRSRKPGRDAFRIVLGQPVSENGQTRVRIFLNTGKVQRSATWQQDLREHIGQFGGSVGVPQRDSELELLGV